MEVTNRFKGLELIDRAPEELWMGVHDIVQEAVIKTIPEKKKCKKAKWLLEEVLQIAEKRKEVKGKGKKETLYPMINQGNFSCKDGHNKGQKWYGPNRSRRY